ncbi:intermembrane transport protein PqiB [Rheinheimera sp. 1928-s]|uniref:intermembrane transport protein PqiB n=1 Tax=Rheinheimera sp. 1928-s TaxID=3033803 RepID=UPI002601C41B|nr:intermembrane transport protein PqiB [Rheinheimera sp. 1928-s]MDF3124099.1 intermembrane transport protein PqiB [Rheinheimera sp. 1928-s]
MQGRVAAVKKIRQLSPIWIVPVMAVVIGIWMLYYTQKNQGPVITLVTLNAEGIVAGKTQIKSRSVDIGRVESVQLSEDLSKVLIKARMDPGLEGLLNEDSQLWVVKPTVGRGGVSGLNTLLSGAYIELQPGKASVQKYYYELLDSPPIAPADAPGVRVTLLSDDATALAVGDPVLYHGYAVGTVETSNFVAEQGHMTYQLFVRAPYDSLVTENVRFWQASGMALDVSAQGVRVELASVATLLSGGVHFDVLDGWPAGDKVASNSEFQLFKNQKAIKEGLYTEYNEYLMFFDESIRGLSAGAPLEYKGIRIGTVAMAPYFFNMDNPLDVAFKRGIPVLVRVEAGRLAGEMSLKKLAQELETAVQQGLRAVLKTGSLLTGALYIELVQTDAQIETPKVKVDVPALADADNSEKVQVATAQPSAFSSEGFVPAPFALADHAGLKIMPTAPSGLANIEQKVLQVLDKVNRLPVEDVLAQSSATLAQSEKMLKNAEQLIQSLDQFVKHNAVQQLPADLQQSLLELRKTLAGFSPGSPAYERLNGNLQSMDQLLRDLQPVIKTMNNQSNSLIFKADLPKDPEPEKGN